MKAEPLSDCERFRFLTKAQGEGLTGSEAICKLIREYLNRGKLP